MPEVPGGDTEAEVSAGQMSWTYVRRLASVSIILPGAFLLCEHVYRYGLDFHDPLGHDWLGLGMIIVGALLATRMEE
jgi:hypothetical protein